MRQLLFFIPARGGSKGIPRKNLAKIGNESLLEISIKKCLSVAQEFAGDSSIVVSTEDEEIAHEALIFGASRIHDRPSELAQDSSTLEEALNHFIMLSGPRLDFSNTFIAVVQCTSPFIRAASLRRGIELVVKENFDSAFTGVKNHYWLYEENSEGYWQPRGHELKSRPPRQRLPATAHETGGGYFFKLEGYSASGFRLFGRVGLVELDNLEAIDIDDPQDLESCRIIADGRALPNRTLG